MAIDDDVKQNLQVPFVLIQLEQKFDVEDNEDKGEESEPPDVLSNLYHSVSYIAQSVHAIDDL